jgi:hypothetical protein
VLVGLKREVAPRMLDHRRYNPMLTVLLMLALTDVLGILGLLLAIPLAAVIQIVLSEFFVPSPVMTVGAQPAALQFEQLETQMVAIQGAVVAADGRLSPIQASLVERLTRLTEDAENAIGPAVVTPPES